MEVEIAGKWDTFNNTINTIKTKYCKHDTIVQYSNKSLPVMS